MPLFSRPHFLLFSQSVKGVGSFLFTPALIEINLANIGNCQYSLRFLSLRIESNGNLAHLTVVTCNVTSASNREPSNGAISKVSLSLFTLIVCKGKISETMIMRSKEKEKIREEYQKRNGNKKERKCDNRNVWRKHDRSFPTRKHDGNASCSCLGENLSRIFQDL